MSYVVNTSKMSECEETNQCNCDQRTSISYSKRCRYFHPHINKMAN